MNGNDNEKCFNGDIKPSFSVGANDAAKGMEAVNNEAANRCSIRKDVFGWAYIGSGSIAHLTARQIVKGGHKIISVYSRNPQKAAAFAKKYGAKCCSDFESAVNAAGVDGVYIATPHTSHVDYATRAMRLGKDVLCEKPVGVCAADVTELINCAAESGRYFVEAMWTWFSDVALTVKNWVQSGKIGKVSSVTINYAFPGLMLPKKSRVRTPSTAGGALLDVGIYPITYCYNLFGYPKSIRCVGEIEDEIDVRETVILGYDGFECRLNMSLRGLREDAVIVGSEGRISLPLFFHMAWFAVLKTREGRTTYRGKTDYLTEFTRVAAEIRDGKKQSDYVPTSATLDCMKILDECRRQMGLRYPFEK